MQSGVFEWWRQESGDDLELQICLVTAALVAALQSTAELPRLARVTFFGAKKVTKENIQVQLKPAIGSEAGIFRRGVLPRRKTVRVLRTALRVSCWGWLYHYGHLDGTTTSRHKMLGLIRGRKVIVLKPCGKT